MRWKSRPAACLLSLVLAASAAAAEDPRKKPATSWDVRLAPAGEPGDPFEMSGVVRDRNGAPLRKAKVFVYHADARGSYTGFGRDLRLASTLLTDSLGRYRIHSVFPGAYGGAPAHVHWEAMEPIGFGFVNVRREGSAAPRSEQSLVVKRDRDGVWRLVMDLRPTMKSRSSLAPGELAKVRPVRRLDASKLRRGDSTAAGVSH